MLDGASNIKRLADEVVMTGTDECFGPAFELVACLSVVRTIRPSMQRQY
jgi:hypothetical protein